MKLVNKKTGQVKTFRFPHYEWGDDDKQYTINMLDYEGNEYNYSTLAELCEEWEDYSSTDESYRLNYVQCTCPKCKKKIILRVYSRVPFLRVEVADICGDVEENEPPRYK